MKTLRTIRCKLTVQPEDASILSQLFGLYAGACTRIAQYGRDHREANAIRLHHALYKEIRRGFGLSRDRKSTRLNSSHRH